MEEYDLIVIGSGPAGEKGAARAAYEGKRVALVEMARAGGTMAGSGVPAKTLRETALHLSGFLKRDSHGTGPRLPENLDVGVFMRHENKVRAIVHAAVEKNLEAHGIRRYGGIASFAEPHVIRVENPAGHTLIRGEIILIASGSRPRRPKVFPFHLPGVYDASTILNMDRLPRNLTVVGGGIVGCEFACLFQALGIPVTMVHGGERFFPFADREISERLKRGMESMGMQVHIFDRVQSIVPDEEDHLRIALESGDVFRADAVLCATGRNSNVERLRLENAGLEAGPNGLIRVDGNYRTSAEHIYAAGDVIGFPALSSTSMEQGRAAVTHAFGFNYENIKSMSCIPFGIWTIPEISMVGESEDSLREKQIRFPAGPPIIGRAEFRKNPRGLVLGEEHGLLKMIFAPDDLRLLGVHILGQEACELIALGLTGLETGMTAYDFVNLTFNFPSLADMYKYAAYAAIGEHRRRGGHEHARAI